MNNFKLERLTVEGRKVHFYGTIYNKLLNRSYKVSGDIHNASIDSVIDDNGKINISIEPLANICSSDKKPFNITITNEECCDGCMTREDLAKSLSNTFNKRVICAY